MKLPRRRFLHLAAGAAVLSFILLTLSDQNAWSQTTRTIRIVVPFPPGGSADILARLLGEQISKANGPTVVIENRPGGGASIAYEAVARRPLAAKVQAAGYRVGLALVLGLMLFATWNDLQRLHVFNFIGRLI